MIKSNVVRRLIGGVLPITLQTALNFSGVRKTATSDHWLQFCPGRPNGTTLLPLDGFLMEFDTRVFFEKLSRKLKFHYNLPTITGTLHADRYTFLIISRSVLLRMRNVSDKSCTENQNTHFVFSNFFSKIVPFMR